MLVECENLMKAAWGLVKAAPDSRFDDRKKHEYVQANLEAIKDKGIYNGEETELAEQMLVRVFSGGPLHRWASVDTKYRVLCLFYKERDSLVGITGNWNQIFGYLEQTRPLYQKLSGGKDPFAEIFL